MSLKAGETIVDDRIALLEAAQQARAHLLTIGTHLVAKAIEEGQPSRDISFDPAYREAQVNLNKAVQALGVIAGSLEYKYE